MVAMGHKDVAQAMVAAPFGGLGTAANLLLACGTALTAADVWKRTGDGKHEQMYMTCAAATAPASARTRDTC